VLYDNLWLSSTDNLGEGTIRCGDRAKMGSMPVDKVERPIRAKDAMSTRGVLILPLFCRSDSESRPLSSADPGSESSADGVHAHFQLRFEKLIRFPPDGLFFSLLHNAYGLNNERLSKTVRSIWTFDWGRYCQLREQQAGQRRHQPVRR
jgi:hypothetical protein